MSDLTLQIAASGIDAATTQLDTAANNLANVTTPGYAREVVNLQDVTGTAATGTGGGVMVTSVTQDGSSLYDQLNLVAQAQLSAAKEAARVQNLAQSSFPTSTGTDLSSQLSQLWTDLSALATEPSNSAARQTVVQDAGQVAGTLNTASTQLSSVAAQLQSSLGQGPTGAPGAPGTGSGYLGRANQLIEQIAQINGQVAGLAAGSGTGGPDVNSLLDGQRAAATTLAGLTGARTTTEADGTMTVTLGGIQLVSGSHATTLQATGAAATANLAVETSDGNVVPAGGTLGAVLTGVDTTIPGYRSGLDAVANALATGLNTLQAGGVSAGGVPGPNAASAAPPYAGPLLPSVFVDAGSATTYTAGAGSAATIRVNPALTADPSLIATAAGTSAAGSATIDPTTAQAMAGVGSAAGGPDSLYQSLVALVGTQTSQANNAQTSAQALADSTSAQQSSQEGVNTNNETVKMVAAQQDYQALASLINSTTTAIQSLLTAV